MASAKGARNAAIYGNEMLAQGEQRVLGELGAGYDQSKGYLNQASGLYNEMTDQGRQGVNRYNSLTLGSGADIQSALEGTGGYQFNLGQGLQALQRTRAAQGMLGSGNTDTDAMSFASGLASNTLNSERQALSPYFNMYQQGMGGETSTLGNLAGLTTDYYGNRGSLIDANNKAGIELTTSALKAGDAAKSANQAMMMQGVTGGLGLLGSLAGGGGGGMGGFTKLAFGK